MAGPRKRPEQHPGIILKKYPAAPRKDICGSTYIYVTCEHCGDHIWSLGTNSRALCNDCVGRFVAADTSHQHAVDPVVFKDRGDA